MTNKLFVGLFPLFTACTIDFEMQLDVGLQDGEELDESLLEEGLDLLEEMSSGDSSDTEGTPNDEGDEEDTTDEESEESESDSSEGEQSPICQIDIFTPFEVTLGEDIDVEWVIQGEPEADTVIALLNETETLHLDFLLAEDTGYLLPSPSEQGEYLVYVASGADLNEPDCFVTASVKVAAEAHTDSESQAEQETESATCDIDSPERSVEEVLSVRAGSTVVLEWDPTLGEVVDVVLYDLDRPENVLLFDTISDDGLYELFVSEAVPQGTYGISFISVDIDACVHFDIEVIHDV